MFDRHYVANQGGRSSGVTEPRELENSVHCVYGYKNPVLVDSIVC
jgi:hypothetical protein